MSNTVAEESYWGYIDETVQRDAQVFTISSMKFDGDEMIRELEHQPIIDFGKYVVDFNTNTWDLTMKGAPPTASNPRMVAHFPDTADAGVWKLYLLCQLIWKTSKTHVCVYDLSGTKKIFADCGGTDARHSLLSLNDYLSFANANLSKKSASTRYRYSNYLLNFLSFRETFFGVPIDSDLRAELQREKKASARILWSMEGTPAIDDEYLVPLVSTCQNVLRSNKETLRNKTAASVLLLATQIGMRVSEAVAIQVGKLKISKLEGKPDIAYLEFKTFKGAKGDGGYRVARTIVNPIALEAYLWLEENCKPYRERLGVDTLVVTPTQTKTYLQGASLSAMIREFILLHHDTIPCINTQGQFPDLDTFPVSRMCKKKVSREPIIDLQALGLTGEETLVVPKFHSFRATVATKLYEAGVDMRYIRKHMSHISEDTTAGYIRSDREIEKQNSDLVYRTVIEDGAKFIGPHGDEFLDKVNKYIEGLPSQVKENLDEVVASTAKAFPLRRKVGGVCIRCGKIVPCKKNDETDQIYCAFGVCPNQCVLYFMVDDCLSAVRSHMELVEANIERGHTKAARNELRKAQNVIRDALLPEIESLEQQIEAHGRDGVIARFPDLEELIDNLDGIKEEVAEWQARKI